FLGKIKEAYDNNPQLSNLLLDPFFKEKVEGAQAGWRRVTATALMNGIPVPSITTALTYFDGYRAEVLPANLLQWTAAIYTYLPAAARSLARSITLISYNMVARWMMNTREERNLIFW
ncbi:MAG: hypothetical protein ACKOU7_07920, partial [Ferruginibacter sp.]